ncbi:hypothetical protein NGRA_0828, partial [Nosema granulosis]
KCYSRCCTLESKKCGIIENFSLVETEDSISDKNSFTLDQTLNHFEAIENINKLENYLLFNNPESLELIYQIRNNLEEKSQKTKTNCWDQLLNSRSAIDDIYIP